MARFDNEDVFGRIGEQTLVPTPNEGEPWFPAKLIFVIIGPQGAWAALDVQVEQRPDYMRRNAAVLGFLLNWDAPGARDELLATLGEAS